MGKELEPVKSPLPELAPGGASWPDVLDIQTALWCFTIAARRFAVTAALRTHRVDHRLVSTANAFDRTMTNLD